MWWIPKPTLFMAAQVKVKVTQTSGYKETSTDLGEVAKYVCLQEHGPGAVRPPRGFETIAGKAPPHVHSMTGPKILRDGEWVVVGNGLVDSMSDVFFRSIFQPMDFRVPTQDDILGKEWNGRLSIQGIEEEHPKTTADYHSLPERL